MSRAGRNRASAETVLTTPVGADIFGVWASTLAEYRAALLRAKFPEPEVFGLVAALQSQLFEKIRSAPAPAEQN